MLNPEKLIIKLVKRKAVLIFSHWDRMLAPFVISISPAQSPVASNLESPNISKSFMGKYNIL